jgi:chromosome segregation ATPase
MSSKYTYESNISSAESRISTHKSEIGTLESQLRSLRGDERDVEGEISGVQSKLDSQNRLVSRAMSKREGVDSQITEANSQIEENKGLMEQRITQAADTVQQEYMPGRENMQNLDIGESVSADKLENVIFKEWKENQAKIAELQASIGKEAARQKALHEEMMELSGYLGAPQKTTTVNGVIAMLTAELDKRSKVPNEILGKVVNDVAARCRQLREELIVEGQRPAAGDNGLFIADYYSIKNIDSFIAGLVEVGLDGEVAKGYFANPLLQEQGVLTDPELITLESSLLSRGIDPRAARVFVLYAIAKDWEGANKSDFNFLSYLDLKFYHAAEQFVDDIRTSDSTMAKQVRRLIDNGAVDEMGIILEDASRMDKIIYAQVDESVQRFRHYAAKLKEREDTMAKLQQIKTDISGRYTSLEQKMGEVRNTISGEITYSLPKSIGKLAGVISLAEAIGYAAELERKVADRSQKKQESSQRQKELEGTLAAETSATGATDFSQGESALENYIAGLVRNFDRLSAEEKELKPDILKVLQEADAYLDQRKEKIAGILAVISGYQASRTQIQGELEGLQKVANSYGSQISTIENGKLAEVRRRISGLESQISQRESSISSLESDISGWESAISRIEYEERQEREESTRRDDSGGGTSFTFHSGGGSTNTGGR